MRNPPGEGLLVDDYGLTGLPDLIEQKRRGEKSELPDVMAIEWQSRVNQFFTRLDAAVAASVLPLQPSDQAVAALQSWLLDLRRRRF